MNQNLYTPFFFLCFFYNFLMGFIFSNNIFFPLYVKQGGGGPDTIGQFMGIFFVAAILGRPLIGMLLDRAGPKWVMLLGVSAMTLPNLGFYAMLGQGLPFLVWGLRFVQGFGWACHLSAYLTLAAAIAPPGRKNEAVSMYSLSGLAANPFGPIIGEKLIAAYGLEAFFIMLIGLGITAFGLMVLVKSTREENDNPFLNFGGIAKILRMPQFVLIFFTAFCFAACYSSVASFLTPVAIEREIEPYSLFFVGFGICGIVIRLIGGHWGDRRGYALVLSPALFCYGAGLIVLNFSYSLIGMVAAGCICGVAHGLAFPLLTSISDTFAPPGQRGTAIALTTGMLDIASSLTALTLGWVGEFYGYGYLFILAAAAPLGAGLVLQFASRPLQHEEAARP